MNAYSNDLHTPLHIACCHGNLPVVKMLVAKECIINRPARHALKRTNGWNMYMKAIDVALVNGHEETVKYLLEEGARYSLKDWLDVPNIKDVLDNKQGLRIFIENFGPV